MLSTPLLNLIALEGNGENSENKKSGRTAFLLGEESLHNKSFWHF